MNSLTIKYGVLILCILSISLGQIFFKLSANTLKTSSSLLALAFEPFFIAAIILYGITTIGWVWCLQEIPLSRAYLFMSLAFIIVPMLGWLFFGEVLHIRFFISASLIIAGILFAMS